MKKNIKIFKDINYFQTKNYDDELLGKIYDIDKKTYIPEYWGTKEGIGIRFKKFNNMFICAEYDSELIGYLGFFPISSRISKIIESYKPNMIIEHDDNDFMFDENLTPDDVENLNSINSYDILIISITVLPEYRNNSIAKTLVNKFHRYIRSEIENGNKINKIWGYTISKGGEAMMGIENYTKYSNVIEKIDSDNLVNAKIFYKKAEDL